MSYGIWTYTGKYFNFSDIKSNEISIIDIAHSLANQTRYTGHCRKHYSVAEHSVRMARQFEDPSLRKWALLHDAPEAFMIDIPRPLKMLLRDNSDFFSTLEYDVETHVFESLGLVKPGEAWTIPGDVKTMDIRILLAEKRDLMHPDIPEWESFAGHEPLEEDIEPWSPEFSKHTFLSEYMSLFPENDWMFQKQQAMQKVMSAIETLRETADRSVKK